MMLKLAKKFTEELKIFSNRNFLPKNIGKIDTKQVVTQVQDRIIT